MLGFMLSQLALRLLSAILGGYGIFCLIMRFAVPDSIEPKPVFTLKSCSVF